VVRELILRWDDQGVSRKTVVLIILIAAAAVALALAGGMLGNFLPR